jgi:hypothetical protein
MVVTVAPATGDFSRPFNSSIVTMKKSHGKVVKNLGNRRSCGEQPQKPDHIYTQKKQGLLLFPLSRHPWFQVAVRTRHARDRGSAYKMIIKDNLRISRYFCKRCRDQRIDVHICCNLSSGRTHRSQ